MGGNRKLSMTTFLTIVFTVNIKYLRKFVVSLNKELTIKKEGMNWEKKQYS